jgi:hypothetical protein
MPQNYQELGDVLLEADQLDVDVHPIRVHYPRQFSMFALSAADLSAALDRLRTQALVVEPRLRRNLPVWRRLLAQLEDQLTRVSGEEARRAELLELDRRAQHAAFANAGDRFARACGQLAASTGRPPLRLGLIDEQIYAVEAPTWADDLLDAVSWQGCSGDEVWARLSKRLAIDHLPPPVPQPDGSLTIDAVGGLSDGSSMAVRVTIVPENDHELWVAVAVRSVESSSPK